MDNIKIAIADDHRILLDGLQILLNAQLDMEVVCVATNGAGLLALFNNNTVSVALVDINMPGMDGVQLTRAIKLHHPHIQVVCLSMYDDAAHILQMMDAGVSSYLLKNTNDEVLLYAIRAVCAGQQFFPPDITAAISRHMSASRGATMPGGLTARELEILALIGREYTNARIASELYISERTVETHRKNMLRKTNHTNMLGLLKFAMDNKLI